MSTFSASNCTLPDELMAILAKQLISDPFYQEQKGKSFDNHPEHLQKLMDTLRVKPDECVLTYIENGLIIRGKTGMIVTGRGIYYKETMGTAKFTSWFELMTNPMIIYMYNGQAISLRVKPGLVDKPFCPACGGNHGEDCVEFWNRIKKTIADFYGLKDASEAEAESRQAIPAKEPAPAAQAPSVPFMSAADELIKLKELLDMGIVTQEEFDAKKKQLLGL